MPVIPPSDPFPWNEIMQSAQEMIESPFMEEMRQRRDASGSKSPMGKLDAGLLYALTRWHQPKVVIETGGFLGMSTAFILKAIRDSGFDHPRVYSAELLEIDQGCLIPDRLRAGYIPLRGRIEDYMKSGLLPERGDMFLHDSSHRLEHMLMEYQFFWDRMPHGGLLVSHDVNMSGAFPKFVDDTYVHDVIGQTDVEASAHREWGRWGNIGFVLKQGSHQFNPEINPGIARPRPLIGEAGVRARKAARAKRVAAKKAAAKRVAAKKAAAKKAAAKKAAAKKS